MAQQMEFDNTSSEQRRSSFQEYESGYRDPFVESYGQKVSPQQVDKAASPRQRLLLAIISLVVLLLMSLGAIGFLTNGGHSITAPVIILLSIIVALFCLTTILVNAIFVRGHVD
jgi:hypothetical protein